MKNITVRGKKTNEKNEKRKKKNPMRVWERSTCQLESPFLSEF